VKTVRSIDIGSTLRKIKRLLLDFFKIQLSVGAICNSLHETGLSAEPVAEKITEAINQADLLHADETGWKEKKKSLWLWVFITVNTCLFMVGGRTKKMTQTFLKNNGFEGWLMSDGYLAYRDYQKRFRCLAYLKRKAKGIKETNWIDGINFGEFILEQFEHFKSAIYESRQSSSSPQSLKKQFRETLLAFQVNCQRYINSEHKATRLLARELLNDWGCIFRILGYPDYQLTNNEAERALSHWVIIRKITQGARSPAGSKSLSILASIIATCRLRAVSTIEFMKDIVVLTRSEALCRYCQRRLTNEGCEHLQNFLQGLDQGFIK
jgi:transposase